MHSFSMYLSIYYVSGTCGHWEYSEDKMIQDSTFMKLKFHIEDTYCKQVSRVFTNCDEFFEWNEYSTGIETSGGELTIIE